MVSVHITAINQTKPTRHMERYGLMTVILTLTAWLLSSLNDLKFFFVFYTLFEFSCTKHLRLMYQSPSFSLRWVAFDLNQLYELLEVSNLTKCTSFPAGQFATLSDKLLQQCLLFEMNLSMYTVAVRLMLGCRLL